VTPEEITVWQGEIRDNAKKAFEAEGFITPALVLLTTRHFKDGTALAEPEELPVVFGGGMSNDEFLTTTRAIAKRSEAIACVFAGEGMVSKDDGENQRALIVHCEERGKYQSVMWIAPIVEERRVGEFEATKPTEGPFGGILPRVN